MLRSRRRRLACAGVVSIVGCAQILGIEDGKPRVEVPGAGSGGAGGEGGEGGEVGGAGGGGGAPIDPLQVSWAERHGGRTNEYLAALSIDLDQIALAGSYNGPFMVGSIPVPAYGASDVFAILLDTTREPLWARGWGDASGANQYAIGVAQHPNEPQVYMTGYYETALALDNTTLTAPTGNGLDGFVARIGDNGTGNSAFPFPGPDTQFPGPIATVPVTNQNLLITGWTRGDMSIAGGTVDASGPASGFLAHIYGAASHGQPDWLLELAVNGSQEGLGIATDSANRIAVAGHFVGQMDIDGRMAFAATKDAFVALVRMQTGAGVCEWLQAIGGDGEEIAYVVGIANDGDVLVAGTFSDALEVTPTLDITDGNADVFVARLRADTGEPLWAISVVSQGLTPRAMVVMGDRMILGADLDGVVSIGATTEVSDGQDFVVLDLSLEDGSLTAGRLFSAPDDQRIVGMVRTSADTVVVGGNLEGTMDLDGHLLESAGGYDFFLAEIVP